MLRYNYTGVVGGGDNYRLYKLAQLHFLPFLKPYYRPVHAACISGANRNIGKGNIPLFDFFGSNQQGHYLRYGSHREPKVGVKLV